MYEHWLRYFFFNFRVGTNETNTYANNKRVDEKLLKKQEPSLLFSVCYYYYLSNYAILTPDTV